MSETSLPFSSGRVKSGALSLIFMPMPNRRSKLKVRTRRSVSDREAFRKILQRETACCRAVLLALLVCLSVGPRTSFAQEDRPQILPGERKPKSKKDSGPRAVAVLQ